jgi:hypothetical protein
MGKEVTMKCINVYYSYTAAPNVKGFRRATKPLSDNQILRPRLELELSLALCYLTVVKTKTFPSFPTLPLVPILSVSTTLY